MSEALVDPDRYLVSSLGERKVASPLGLCTSDGRETPGYVGEGTRVLCRVELAPGDRPDASRTFEKAGPRERIFFDPKRTRAAVLTSGGLCPGINNVLRSLVFELVHKYGTVPVVGLRYGFAGLDPATALGEPLELDPAAVRHVHNRGGTMLGTSRGGHDARVMVDSLVERKIDVLFAIGGDGTMRGAHAIAEEVARRGLSIGVVGIPKTIDNDIAFVDKTFGFETAVSVARDAIDAAHTEALSVRGGIGLVKLMGREAGFITAHATIASHDVNVCLIPEVPFRIERVLEHVEKRLAERGHAVIVVAEGCVKQLPTDAGAAPQRDASGNLSFANADVDIGKHLKRAIEAHLESRKVPFTLKYIDPSYMLRGVAADAIDAVFCAELARFAVHAAMAGKTDMMIGRLHRAFTHVPLPLVLSQKKRVDPESELWLAVTESTGQPRLA